MNLKAAYKYQLTDHTKSVIIYYCVIVVLFALLSIATVNYSTGGSMISGMDSITVVFLFIVGLCTFREPFVMLLQNGFSRKSIFKSRLLVACTVVLIMAAIDKVILLLGKALSMSSSNSSFLSLYEQVYPASTAHVSPFLFHLNIFVFDLLMYFTFLAIGYLITLIFYRLNKAGKIAVGAGVPIFFCLIFPIFDYAFFGSGISRAFANFFDSIMGISAGNPYAAMLSFIVISVIISALSWLLMRRAVIKL